MVRKDIPPHITEWKKGQVDRLSKNIGKYKTVALVSMENLPSKQLQSIRAKISDRVEIGMARKHFIKLSCQQTKKTALKELSDKDIPMPALIFSDLNSFELFRILKENMTAAPAKAGQTAPDDIIVEAGPTPFAPGPILSELGAVGIKAGIEGGKVVIKETATVVKQGESVSAKAAGILSRLGVNPMKIGINLIAAVENNELFDRKLLDINTEEYIQNIQLAHTEAFKLAIAQGILTPETVTHVISQAAREALAVATEFAIPTKETLEPLLAKAEAQAKALKAMVPEAPKASPKAEEKPAEEPKEEPKEIIESKSEESEKPPEQGIENTGRVSKGG